MHIAIVVNTFPTVSETFIVNQITALIDEGHTVKIYSKKKGSLETIHNSILKYSLLEEAYFNRKKPYNKIKRVLLFFKLLFQHSFELNWGLLFKAFNFLKYGNDALSLTLFYKLQFFILHKKFDVIHAHFGVHARPIVGLKAKGFLRKCKLIVSFHGFDINPSKIEYYKTYYNTLFKYADEITVNTQYTKALLLEVNPTLTNISLLPVGLDTNLFQKKEPPHLIDEDFKLVYCGRLVPFKGALLLPQILNELEVRGIQSIALKIIGNGVLKEPLINEIEKFNLQHKITVLGAITQEDIKAIFSASDAFILPGIYNHLDGGRAENQGLVIQEAQAMELPVIVSDVGGMKYGLIPNETGFVVKENDISGFVDAIRKLIENPLLAKQMGEKGRAFVVENYDSKVLVQQLLAIYLR
ncbi:glycosyltransferase family 4 protein [Winogradskyella helgolandensis]|uniref:glycosyltransferase family 4 protein n=1 Tax=Winogradskyella helgolandensis TaxID=2697010 RepID=UPI0015CE558A|nr:glycosyltransferase family 4 protein [Winogradskyella helgolandensis]